MNTKKLKRNTGFTLIEALVYMALFGILMGGAIVAAYNIFESGSRDNAKVIVQEEGDFLLGKISWALSGISAINSPVIGSSSSQLSVTSLNPAIGSISIKPNLNALGGQDMIMIRGGVNQTLNNSNVTVDNILFDYSNDNGVEWTSASFTLNTKTADGKALSQSFKSTKYLKK